MTKLIKIIATAAALTTIAGTAEASDSFTASFTYDAKASVASNYDNFVKSAEMACINEARSGGFTRASAKSYVVRKCQRQLVKRAVKASGIAPLATLHAIETSPKSKTRQYAAK